ncbi:hypothetical protein D3C72_1368530 [compost metagenome]
MPAGVGEVVDHRRTKGGGQGVVDGLEGHAQGAGLFPVDVDPQLRRLGQPFHHRVEDDRVAVGLAQDLVARCQQGLTAQAATVEQAQGETTGVAQAIDRWRVYRHDRAIAVAGELRVDRLGFGIHRLLGAAHRPVLVGRERQRGVLAHAGEAEATDHERRGQGFTRHQELLQGLPGSIGTHTAGARRQLHVDNGIALVFHRHE